jgi:hypothetical protein
METSYAVIRRQLAEHFARGENKAAIFYCALMAWCFFATVDTAVLVVLGANTVERSGFSFFACFYALMLGLTTWFLLDAHRRVILADALRAQQLQAGAGRQDDEAGVVENI